MVTDARKWAEEEVAAWSTGDIDKILSFYTDDCVYEDIALGRVSSGMGELRAFVQDNFTAFPDFRVELKSCLTSGEHVCIESAISGMLQQLGVAPPLGQAGT